MIIAVGKSYSSERAFSEEGEDFVPIADMVLHHHLIVTLVVIIAAIKLFLRGPVYLRGAYPQEVDFLVVQNLSFLEVRQLIQEKLQGFPWMHWKFLTLRLKGWTYNYFIMVGACLL